MANVRLVIFPPATEMLREQLIRTIDVLAELDPRRLHWLADEAEDAAYIAGVRDATARVLREHRAPRHGPKRTRARMLKMRPPDR